MRLILDIAWRYLVGKKSAQAINIITWISVVGMAIGTAVLMIIFSVFNGFEDLLSGMLSKFNPEIKVVLKKGKYEDAQTINLPALRKIEGIANISFTLEETAFFETNGSQEVGIIKGVDSAFVRVTGIDSSLVSGVVRFGEESIYGVCGIGMYNKLSINTRDPFATISCYMPSQSSSALDQGYNNIQIYPSGAFSVGGEIDQQYVLVDIDAVNELLDLEHAFTAIEIKLNAYTNVKSMKHAIQNVVGPKYKIMDKYEQDEAFLRIMNIEKWISYLIASLSLLIIAFNMVGSLWMLVLEKSKDIAILKSMGFSDQKIKWIYLTLGWMISIIGLVAGMVLATIAYYGQKEYGWVSIPEGFLIDAYPVKWVWRDMLIVILTVLAIGYIASIIPSRRAAKISKLISTINR